MPKLVTYKCPECTGTFDFLHHPSDEPPPDRCELCNAWMGDEPEKAPVLHLNFGKERNRVPDQVYRKMEKASSERAEDAAELVGGSAHEMSGIKITDMKDNTRPGEHSAVVALPSAPPRELSYQMPNGQNHKVQPQFAPLAAEEAKARAEDMKHGPAALSTRKMFDSMPHANLIAQATAAGSDGKRH